MSKTSRNSSTPTSVRHPRTRLAIVPQSSGWAVRKSGSTGATRVYSTQREAERAAKEMIRTKHESGGEIVVHGRDGRIRSVNTYALGMESFRGVSAIEGIFLTEDMRRDFRMLDRKGLTPAARRRWLIAKYGK